jgi:hypothetical protein
MATMAMTTNNYGTMRVEGMVNLSAAGAVSSSRGDGISVAKTGTGLYTVTFKNHDEYILHEVLGVGAHLVDATIGTVKDVGIESEPTQLTDGTGDITFVFHTVDAAGADVDEATSALVVAFYFVMRTIRMTQPFH